MGNNLFYMVAFGDGNSGLLCLEEGKTPKEVFKDNEVASWYIISRDDISKNIKDRLEFLADGE